MGWTKQTARKQVKAIVKTLNKEGFTGGIYTYKKGECSCCFGLEKVFFQVNDNIPSNWCDDADMTYKFTYDTKDVEKATKFRLLLNKLVADIPNATQAEDNTQAIMIKE